MLCAGSANTEVHENNFETGIKIQKQNNGRINKRKEKPLALYFIGSKYQIKTCHSMQSI